MSEYTSLNSFRRTTIRKSVSLLKASSMTSSSLSIKGWTSHFDVEHKLATSHVLILLAVIITVYGEEETAGSKEVTTFYFR